MSIKQLSTLAVSDYAKKISQFFKDTPTADAAALQTYIEGLDTASRGARLKEALLQTKRIYPYQPEIVGSVVSVSIDTAGTGYIEGEYLTVVGDGVGATVKVKTVDATGAITSLEVFGGTGYTSATVSGGSGTGATFTATVGTEPNEGDVIDQVIANL